MKTINAHSLEYALNVLRNGGELYVATAMRYIPITGKTLKKFEAAGCWLLKEEGEGYRLKMGKGSVYLLPGQLKEV